jgi:sugar phosphate permease
LVNSDRSLIEKPILHQEGKDRNNRRKIKFLDSFKIPGIIAFSISFFFIKLTSYAIYYWYPTYLQTEKNFSKPDALDTFRIFSSGGTVGMILMGIVSDFTPMRSLVFEAGIVISTVCNLMIASSSNTWTK